MAVQLLVVLILVGFLDVYSAGKSPKINVQMTAPWPSSKFYPILEASEFVAKDVCSLLSYFAFSVCVQDPDMFWKFIGAAVNLTETSPSVNPYSLALSCATPLLAPTMVDLLSVSLSVRSLSPTIELHRQVRLRMFIFYTYCDRAVGLGVISFAKLLKR
jgi:hypothetical protein